MIRGLRTFPLLDGFRGAPPVDLGALEDVVVRIGALAAAHPEIVELDLNPVIASPTGAVVVDARVRVAAPGPPSAVSGDRPLSSPATARRVRPGGARR